MCQPSVVLLHSHTHAAHSEQHNRWAFNIHAHIEERMNVLSTLDLKTYIHTPEGPDVLTV